MDNIKEIYNNIKKMKSSKNIPEIANCYVNVLIALEELYKLRINELNKRRNDGNSELEDR